MCNCSILQFFQKMFIKNEDFSHIRRFYFFDFICFIFKHFQKKSWAYGCFFLHFVMNDSVDELFVVNRSVFIEIKLLKDHTSVRFWEAFRQTPLSQILSRNFTRIVQIVWFKGWKERLKVLQNPRYSLVFSISWSDHDQQTFADLASIARLENRQEELDKTDGARLVKVNFFEQFFISTGSVFQFFGWNLPVVIYIDVIEGWLKFN